MSSLLFTLIIMLFLVLSFYLIFGTFSIHEVWKYLMLRNYIFPKPCQYLLLKREENGKDNLYIIALYRNWRGKLKHFEIERNLFLKYFPEDLKYIENQMTKSNSEEFEVKA